MCLFEGGNKSPSPEPTPPPPREPQLQRTALSLQINERRRRASAFNTKRITLTSPLGVSNFGSASRGVTVVGRA